MKHANLQHEIQKREAFDSPEQEAFLNVQRSASLLGVPFDRLFKSRGLTGASYNVLRILRGAGECGRACHEIGEQMVAHVPDVTRLIDRLEGEKLVTRSRCDKDRRVIHVKISKAGLEMLASLDGPLSDLHKAQLGHLARKELAELNRILVKARQFKMESPGAPTLRSRAAPAKRS